jgi:stage II sporulation protein D
MRILIAGCFMAYAVLLAAPARATELIRVLLFEDVQQVEVSADRGIAVRASSGEISVLPSPVTVASVAGAITVNGQRVRGDSVTIRGRDQDLTITVRPSASDPRAVRPNDGRPVLPNAGPPEGTRASPPGASLVVGGTLKLSDRGRGVTVVNELDLEEYVKGVLPAEMSSGWHPEALRAQAVAARTYAVYQRLAVASREYDLVASTQDQVYRGRQGLDARVQEAVETTRGLILTHQNAPVLAAFSSTAAGPTEDALNVWDKDLPYLKGVDCPFDTNSPYYQWRAAFKIEDLETGLRRFGVSVGTIATLTTYAYSNAGRVTRVRILHSQGELVLRGEDLRRVVGYTVIPSTQFEVVTVGRDIVLSGRGAGHAVGLCQWGAKELAELGYPFSTILRYYFPGTDLKALQSLALAR